MAWKRSRVRIPVAPHRRLFGGAFFYVRLGTAQSSVNCRFLVRSAVRSRRRRRRQSKLSLSRSTSTRSCGKPRSGLRPPQRRRCKHAPPAPPQDRRIFNRCEPVLICRNAVLATVAGNRPTSPACPTNQRHRSALGHHRKSRRDGSLRRQSRSGFRLDSRKNRRVGS